MGRNFRFLIPLVVPVVSIVVLLMCTRSPRDVEQASKDVAAPEAVERWEGQTLHSPGDAAGTAVTGGEQASLGLARQESSGSTNAFPRFRERILGSTERPYTGNPYIPAVATNCDFTRVYSSGGVRKLDDVPLRLPREYAWDLMGEYAFSPIDSGFLFTVPFRIGSEDQTFVYRKENGQLSECGPYQSVHRLQFSQDGKHFLFAAQDSEKQWWIWIDGKKRYCCFSERPLVSFGAANAAVFYTLKSDDEWRVFQNDRLVYGPCSRVEQLQVSASGRVAMEAVKREEHFLVIDGKEKGPYKDVWAFSFDPPGRRYACTVSLPGEEGHRAVIDGSLGTEFEAVFPPVFSPHGTSVAFVASQTPKPPPPKVLPDGSIVVTVLEAETRDKLVIVNGEVRLTKRYSGLQLLGLPGYGIHELCVNDPGTRFVYVDVVNPPDAYASGRPIFHVTGT